MSLSDYTDYFWITLDVSPNYLLHGNYGPIYQ